MPTSFANEVWLHIQAISGLRSANAPPPPDAPEHLDFLDGVLHRLDDVLGRPDPEAAPRKRADFEARDIRALRFSLEKLRRYHSAGGVEAVGFTEARVHLYFVQGRLMDLVREYGYELAGI